MKALIRIFSFLLPAVICGDLGAQAGCSYTWTLQSSGTTQILKSVAAVDEMVCWIAGNSGTVLRTTDGGTTWLNGNPNPGIITGNVENIEAIDGDNAWCSTSPSINTIIYKTTDGGNSWVIVYSQVGGFINGIHMVSASSGYAFGDPISNVWNILMTTNGGTNWIPVPTSPNAQPAEAGFNNCIQVSLPYIWFGASLGSVYRSTNAGLNWTSHATPGIFIYVQAVHFNSNLTGMASGTNMVKSTDGGANYLSHTVPGAGNITAIEGSGNEFFFVRGQYVYRTTNAGDNWVMVHDASINQTDLDFADNLSGCRTGWLAGYAGTITKAAGQVVGNGSQESKLPEAYRLEQNHPNPFNPVTKIKFALPLGGYISLKLYDILGKEVRVLDNSYRQAGHYEAEFDGSNLASGVYFYRLEAKDFVSVRKMILVK